MGTIDASVRINIRVHVDDVGGVVTRVHLIQQRACCDRGDSRVHLRASVGVLVEITLHVLHDGSRCALSIQQSAPHELERLVVIARVLSLSLCVSVSRRVSSSRRSAFVSAGVLFSSLPALSVSSLPALFSLWSVLVFLLLWSLLCSRLFTLSIVLSSLFLLLSHLCLD